MWSNSWIKQPNYLRSFFRFQFLCFYSISTLVKKDSTLTYSCGYKAVHTLPKCISQKVNIIASLEFEFSYYNVTVQHISQYPFGIPLV